MTDILQEILKIPATQNIAKNRTDFPMHEQSISNSKTEAITCGMIQNINRKIPFYPDMIYMPPPNPTKINNQQEQKLNRCESKNRLGILGKIHCTRRNNFRNIPKTK